MPSANVHLNGRRLRAVILDYGEVLSFPPPRESTDAMAELFHVSREKFREFYYAERNPYDRGAITAERYWQAIARDAGLALSTAAVATFGGVALFAILRGRIGGIYGRNLIESFAKIALASAVMGAAVWLSSHGMEGWLGVGRFARLFDLAVSIPLGLVVFYGACRLLRVSELDLATRALAGHRPASQ